MFCPKCGTNNIDSVNFCATCGAELVDNQPEQKTITMNTVIAGAKELPAKIKTLPKLVKQLSVAALALIVVIIAVSAVGSAVTDPKNIAKGYFEAKANGDWNKMYGYLSLDNSDFINKNNFLKLMGNEEKLEIVNFEISDSLSNGSSYEGYFVSTSDSGMVKTYVVEYLLKGNSSTQSETITLVKNSGKKLLFYDDYDVNIDNLIISNYQISVPKGSTVYLDEIKLTQKTSSSENDYYDSDSSSDTYVISKIFSGQHDLKVEHPVCAVYTEKIQVSGSGSCGSIYSVSKLELNESVKSDLAKKTEETYKQIISSALAQKEFDSLNLICTSESEQQVSIKESYDNLVSELKNEDGTGYKSITVTKFTDESSQKELKASGTYSCELRIEYDYVTISKDWWTDELSESPSSYPRSSSIRFTYVYESDAWVLQNLYSLGI